MNPLRNFVLSLYYFPKFVYNSFFFLSFSIFRHKTSYQHFPFFHNNFLRKAFSLTTFSISFNYFVPLLSLIPFPSHLPSSLLSFRPKGVGPSTTLAWSGWKQTDIPVEVDTARLETRWFKNGFSKCVLLYYPSSEFESTFNAYWNGVGAAGLSCRELPIWEFPFLRGGCRQWGNSIWYCVNGMPQKDTLDSVAYTCMLLYSIDIFHLSFNFLCLLLL